MGANAMAVNGSANAAVDVPPELGVYRTNLYQENLYQARIYRMLEVV
jgi:hypothetical protein